VFRLLRRRDFALLVGGQAVSELGDGIFFVALAWRVYQSYSNPAALSVVGIAFFVPRLLVTIAGGVVSDRFERRWTMVAADCVRAVAVALLAAIELGSGQELPLPRGQAVHAAIDVQGQAHDVEDGARPLFTRTLLDEIDPRRMKIVAVDALPVELPYIEKGLAPVLLAQPTYLWGEVSVNTVVDKIVLGKQVPERIPMELVRVSKDNLGDWARQLKGWGFTDVPDRYLHMGERAK